MRTRLFLLSAFCFLLSESSYAQTITTAGVAWKGTNGADVFAINPTGSVTSPFFIGDGSQLTGISGGSGTGIATNGGSGTGNTFSNATLLTTTATTNYMTINGTGTARSAFVIDGNLSQRFRMMDAYYDANTALFGVVFPNGLTSESTIVGSSFSGDGSSLTALNASALATGYVPRPVTNSAVKTGDLVVTNNATISGNISVAGTFGVNTAYVTNLIVITTNDLPQTQSFSYFEDFLGNQLTTSGNGFGCLGFLKAVSGTGSTGANGTPTTNAPGIQTLNLGTQTTGNAFMYNFGAGGDNAMYSLRGVWTNEWRIRLSGTNNAAGTNNYQFQAGFSDAAASFTTVDGAFPYYATNSPYIGLVTANNSTRTTNYSTFAPDTNTWFKVRVVVTANATLTNAVMTINGANNVTNTSNIPTGGTRNVALQAGIAKIDGTDSRLFDVDYVFLGYSLETSR